jgi:hypothetical protein
MDLCGLLALLKQSISALSSGYSSVPLTWVLRKGELWHCGFYCGYKKRPMLGVT